MGFFARSIRYRLLLVIVATVLAVVIVHDVIASRELRRMAIAVANARLTAVSNQLGDVLSLQARQMRRQVATTAHDPAVRAFLNEPTSAARRDSAARVLQRNLVGNLVAVTVWGPNGERLLNVGAPSELDASVARRLIAAADASPDSTAMSELARVNDSLAYSAIARVADGKRPLGAVVEWKKSGRSQATRQQLLGLIGFDAAILVGNVDGEPWTDFADFVRRPPTSLVTAGGTPTLTTYERPTTGKQLASVRAIGGTPWMLVIEFPYGHVVAPVRAGVTRLLLSTIPLLVLGIGLAWWFGTRLTTPLRNLADAARGISAGDYARRVTITSADEAGTLGGAFNRMADSIAVAHRVLAERAEELAQRAEQLEEQAGELEMANEELADSVDELTRTRDELTSVSGELDACLASAPVGFALYDENGRYRRVNASLAKLHGVDADAHVDRLPSEVVPGLGADVERHVATVLAGRTAVMNVELSGDAAARGGVPKHWLVSVFPILTGDADQVRVGSVVTDLSAYKQLERQLLQSQKMEAVGRLAGGVAHDFNNILTAISGFGQFVLTDVTHAANADAKADIEQVLAAAERGGALTRQLLAFSRQQVLQPRVLDLNAVVTSLGPMLARLIGTDIQMRTIASPQLSAVKADPNQMEQVLVNLVVNARDAMPAGGTITIETADVELDETYADSHDGVAPGRYVVLAVTDSGTGMDAATRARVFDPFFTTKGPGKGTGLGLSTVYGIVKQSGGNVEAYSEPGRGTSFKIYLPRCVERLDTETVARGVVTPNGRAKVLLVDDDPHVSAAARRALERAGYTVVSAGNGVEGIRAATDHKGPLDILITDLVMPEMGGRELARRIRDVRPGIRILYTSGYTAQAMNQQAVLEPGDAFLGKPFTPDALLRRVDEVLHPVVA
jgi:PAS domain S-box-containing protein